MPVFNASRVGRAALTLFVASLGYFDTRFSGQSRGVQENLMSDTFVSLEGR